MSQVYGNRGGGGGNDAPETEDALSLKQGRLLFMRAVKESYESQEASGMLRWTAAANLTHIADALDDSITSSSQVRRKYISKPSYRAIFFRFTYLFIDFCFVLFIYFLMGHWTMST
jgi:hypothetical protein